MQQMFLRTRTKLVPGKATHKSRHKIRIDAMANRIFDANDLSEN